MRGLLRPIGLATSQLNDPAFSKVLLQTVAYSIACFAGIYVLAVWMIQQLLDLHSWRAWIVDLLGSIALSLLTLWLFLPVAAAIGMMHFDRIAVMVERRFYHSLPPLGGASFFEQAWDGMVVALKVFALNLVALILAFILPGVGVMLGWIIATYAIGRGLFVAVAMRRMSRNRAESLYGSKRGVVLVQGGILALLAYIPILNLLIPFMGVAAMVHVLDTALTAGEMSAQ